MKIKQFGNNIIVAVGFLRVYEPYFAFERRKADNTKFSKCTTHSSETLTFQNQPAKSEIALDLYVVSAETKTY